MSATASYKRKSVSLETDVAMAAEAQAHKEGRSLSNFVNFRLRQAMAKIPTPKVKEAKA